MPRAVAVGLFVGGHGSRFGGVAKGNLRVRNGERLIVRLSEVSRQALPNAPMFLVGNRGEYADLEHETLGDTPPGVGPLGGLRALLRRTAEDGYEAAVALACDLPYVTPELIGRLAREQPGARALAPREDGRWYALTARYSIALLPEIDEALAEHQHSLQKLFTRAGASARRLAVDEGELASLRDWDSPEDLAP